jgi:uncharacterized protein YutE (UPF0331/DUF86 family)
MESELSDFPKFSKIDRKIFSADRDVRRNLERWVENLVNCSIDMAKVILAAEGRNIPSTYRETLREIGTTKFFDEKFGEDFSRWAGLRNILAHEYLDFRWESLKKFLESAEPDFKVLCLKIRSILED